MLFSQFARFPPISVSPKALTYNASSPSVTSVTSVRCFPQFARFPPISHGVTEASHLRTLSVSEMRK
jgi:hypothetical protein